eukprot:TRINITY_DN13672_c0_g1_i2.p1 TRINITY_DN13672_c0_g1~~TRINITY_DN13672_c0_g1_i2.p1  ORF type:complete len:316 (-),score=126.20 TRINITY_DN13672_c0_g1_i2:21-929(-)
MDIDTYESIISSISKTSLDFDKALTELVEEFPKVRKESVRSILSQEHQKHIKKGFKACNNEGRKAAVYRSVKQSIADGQPGGAIVRLAQDAGDSSALTARIVLEEYLTENTEIALKPGEYKDQALKSQTSMLMKDTTLIEDGKLAMEIFLANIKDDSYGPVAEAIKHSIGEEHEQKLKDCLTKLDIPFSDENVLRGQGYDKTPDIKLEVPIAVDGHIINWIESKALFGDPEAHQGYLRDQFWSYMNRFGPGMVIYWFGYINQLDTNRSAGIILTDHFPTNIVRYEPEIIKNFSGPEEENKQE